jgi:dTDP-4-dehydrorhamnose 3,5-epimerase
MTTHGVPAATRNEGLAVEGVLPEGVRGVRIVRHADDRGWLAEVYRTAWKGGETPLQWNLVASEGGVQRGVHVHLGYDETYLLLDGALTVGFRDTRRGSPTEGATALAELAGGPEWAVFVPPGLAHGLLFREPSRLLVGTTAYWDPRNELGCHWLDPDLGIPWPTKRARLSERDAAFPPLAAIRDRIPPWRPAQ